MPDIDQPAGSAALAAKAAGSWSDPASWRPPKAFGRRWANAERDYEIWRRSARRAFADYLIQLVPRYLEHPWQRSRTELPQHAERIDLAETPEDLGVYDV